MTTLLQDDKGNKSTMRVAFLIGVVVFIFLLLLFTHMAILESRKEVVDYLGLAALFTATVTELGLVLYFKTLQKKYENK